MREYDASSSEVRIYTRRAGLLGAVGHDLELRVREFTLEVDEVTRSVRARFSARALAVVDAVEGRTRRPGKLSPKDKTEIEAAIAEQVLHAERYPAIEFRSAEVTDVPGGVRVRGTLRLHGQERELAFGARVQGSRLEGELELQQPDFGITPYRALGGALKVRPELTICFSLPDPRAPLPAPNAGE